MASVLIGYFLALVTNLIAFKGKLKITKGMWLNILLIAGAGVFCDWLFGYKLGMWSYPHHPYWAIDYWLLLPLAWIAHGIWLRSLWILCQKQMKSHSLALTAFITFVIAAISEFVGELRGAWSYGWMPPYLLILGWWFWVAFWTVAYDNAIIKLCSVISILRSYINGGRRQIRAL